MNSIEYIQSVLQTTNTEAGHDWWHIQRVLQNVDQIAAEEPGFIDQITLKLATLVHDVGDAKFHDGDEDRGREKVIQLLHEAGIDLHQLEKVMDIVDRVSYRHSFDDQEQKSLELAILQDADRLDAMGAVGIARAFSFGGYKGNPFYDPKIEPRKELDAQAYKDRHRPTINHFYEKLLLLKDKMNTPTGRKLANERHHYMMGFLRQFAKETGILLP